MAGVFPEDINDTIDEEKAGSDEEIEDVGIPYEEVRTWRMACDIANELCAQL